MIVKPNLFEKLAEAFGSITKIIGGDSKPYVAGAKVQPVGQPLNNTADPHPVTDRETHRAALAKKGVGANVPFDII